MDPFARARPLAYCRDWPQRREHTVAKDPKSARDAQAVDTDTDRYPDLTDVFSKILETTDLPEGPVELVSVSCFAGGDATYRITPARAEEPIIGYIPKV